MCCAFNAESALRKSTYSELVQSMQTLSNPTSASGDEIKKIKTGEQNGLTLWLDQHSDNTSFGTIYDDYNGFKVTLNYCIQDERRSKFSFRCLLVSQQSSLWWGRGVWLCSLGGNTSWRWLASWSPLISRQRAWMSNTGIADFFLWVCNIYIEIIPQGLLHKGRG